VPTAPIPYDALLVVSFGGPEGPDDVLPFLENVTRGRGIPRERLAEVGAHYAHFGGVSPINGLNRELIASVQVELAAHGVDLPIYWGNRNWHPMLADTVATMRDDGVRHALAFVTSAYSSYSGCRQYLEDLDRARQAVGDGAPAISKLRAFFDHPGFVEPLAARVAAAYDELPPDRRPGARLVCTAHSIPVSMATSSPYVAQLLETARLVAERVAVIRNLPEPPDLDLVWQSRSGPPTVPWLAPDINDHLRALAARGVGAVVVAPIGFIADHVEVRWDLDTEARATADELGLAFVRAATVSDDPAFVGMIRELIEERLAPETAVRLHLGAMGVRPDLCPGDCCPAPARPATRPIAPPSGQ
jgi:ferrochelatase